MDTSTIDDPSTTYTDKNPVTTTNTVSQDDMSMDTSTINDLSTTYTDKNPVTTTNTVSQDDMSMDTSTINDPSTTCTDKNPLTLTSTVSVNNVCIQENTISTITGLSEDYLVQNTYVDAMNDKSTRETCTDDFHVEDNVPDFGLMLDNEGGNNSGNSKKCMEREIGLVKSATNYQNAASSTLTFMVQDVEYGNNLQHLPAFFQNVLTKQNCLENTLICTIL